MFFSGIFLLLEQCGVSFNTIEGEESASPPLFINRETSIQPSTTSNPLVMLNKMAVWARGDCQELGLYQAFPCNIG